MDKRIKMKLMGLGIGIIGVIIYKFILTNFGDVSNNRLLAFSANGSPILTFSFGLIYVVPFFLAIKYLIAMFKVYDRQNYGFYFFGHYVVAVIITNIVYLLG